MSADNIFVLVIYLVCGIFLVGFVFGISDVLDRFPRLIKVIIRLTLVVLWMPFLFAVMIGVAAYIVKEYIFGE